MILAVGFIPSGIVKIMGERFTALPNNHPLGHYLEALHHTGYYYPFIGVTQVIAAILLLIPRTALLGAIVYFPIILNICILAYASRFEGTRITTLMVMANLFLLAWDYDRLKHILPIKQPDDETAKKNSTTDNRFPLAFFGLVIVTVAAVITINHFLYDIRGGVVDLYGYGPGRFIATGTGADNFYLFEVFRACAGNIIEPDGEPFLLTLAFLFWRICVLDKIKPVFNAIEYQITFAVAGREKSHALVGDQANLEFCLVIFSDDRL